MKKIYTMALAAVMATGIASAEESVTVSFDRTGTDAASVTATTDVEGVTATLTSVTPDMRATAGNITPAILCPNVNGNTGANIDFALSVAGLPANAKIEAINLDIHALNGTNGYQQNDDNKKRFWNVALTLDGTAFASSEFDVAAGVATDGKCHKPWTFTPAAAVSATAPLSLSINVTSSAATNEGCFFGLSDVTIKYSVDAAPANYSVMFVVKDQTGAFVSDAKVELFDNAEFTGAPVNYAPYYTDTYGETSTIRFTSTNGQTVYHYRATKGTWDVVTGTVDFSESASQTKTIEMNNPDAAVSGPVDYTVTFLVVDQTGAPVNNARVTLYDSATGYIPINYTSFSTDATGYTSAIRFTNDKGQTEFFYTVAPNQSGWEPVKGSFDFGNETTKTVTVVLQNPDATNTYTAHFTVLDKDSKAPVEGAQIAINYQTYTTSAAGQATVTIENADKSEYYYSVTAENYEQEIGNVDFSEDATRNVNVYMTSTLPPVTDYEVTFIVTDKETGKPMKGVEANIYNDKNEILIGDETDENGEATVTIKDPQQTSYAYSVYAGKTYDEQKGTLDFSKETRQVLKVAMSGQAKIEGWTVMANVLDEQRKPIVNAVASYAGEIYRSTSGFINFTAPKSENPVVSVTFSATGYEDNVVDFDFSKGESVYQDVILTKEKVLGEPFTANFTVTNDSEEPLSGAKVTVDGKSADTDAEGHATFTIDNNTAAETHVFAYTVVMNGYEIATGKLDFDTATDGVLNETVIMQPIAIDPDWTDLGTVAYTDFITGATWNVTARKHNDRAVYRLVNPYTNGNQPEKFIAQDPSVTVYLEFDATDPEAVTINTGDKEYLALNMFDSGSDFLGEFYLKPVEGATGTYADGKITFAKNQLTYFYHMFGPAVLQEAACDMVVDFEPQAGIGAIEATAGSTVVYDLQGRRVSRPAAHGIYIINGKKVRL